MNSLIRFRRRIFNSPAPGVNRRSFACGDCVSVANLNPAVEVQTSVDDSPVCRIDPSPWAFVTSASQGFRRTPELRAASPYRGGCS